MAGTNPPGARRQELSPLRPYFSHGSAFGGECINPHPGSMGSLLPPPMWDAGRVSSPERLAKQGQGVRLNAPCLPHTLELVGLTDITYGRIWVGPFQMLGWFLTQQHILLD